MYTPKYSDQKTNFGCHNRNVSAVVSTSFLHEFVILVNLLRIPDRTLYSIHENRLIPFLFIYFRNMSHQLILLSLVCLFHSLFIFAINQNFRKTQTKDQIPECHRTSYVLINSSTFALRLDLPLAFLLQLHFLLHTSYLWSHPRGFDSCGIS